MAAYVGTTVPVVAIRALLLIVDVVPAVVAFAVLAAAVVPLGVALLLRHADA